MFRMIAAHSHTHSHVYIVSALNGCEHVRYHGRRRSKRDLDTTVRSWHSFHELLQSRLHKHIRCYCLVVKSLHEKGNGDEDKGEKECVATESSCDNISTTSALNAKLDEHNFDNKKMKIRAFGNRTLNVNKT